jgi:hypothetical protein
MSDVPLTPGTEAWLSVRPEVIRVADGRAAEVADTAHWNVLKAEIAELVYAGSSVRVHARLAGGQGLVAHTDAGSPLQPGAEVRLSWPIDRGRCVR